jgi:hypothetical protein
MQAYLSFDKISEETKFQLGGKLGSGGEVAPSLRCPIANYAPFLKPRTAEK